MKLKTFRISYKGPYSLGYAFVRGESEDDAIKNFFKDDENGTALITKIKEESVPEPFKSDLPEEEFDLRYCPHCNRMVNSLAKPKESNVR